MQRGGSSPWWTRSNADSDEMTYECDGNLGSPQEVDCAQVEYQLDGLSDTIQIGPGEVKFLSSSEYL